MNYYFKLVFYLCLWMICVMFLWNIRYCLLSYTISVESSFISLCKVWYFCSTGAVLTRRSPCTTVTHMGISVNWTEICWLQFHYFNYLDRTASFLINILTLMCKKLLLSIIGFVQCAEIKFTARWLHSQTLIWSGINQVNFICLNKNSLLLFVL